MPNAQTQLQNNLKYITVSICDNSQVIGAELLVPKDRDNG
jgi:hypothetical protein